MRHFKTVALLLGCGVATACASSRPVALMNVVENDTLRLYVAHAERDWPGSVEQQEMTDTLTRLADAVADLATVTRTTSPALTRQIDGLRQATRKFAAGKGKEGRPEQAALLQEVFLTAATTIGSLADAARVGKAARIDELTKAARALNPDEPLPGQGEAIEQFFRDAAASMEPIDALVR